MNMLQIYVDFSSVYLIDILKLFYKYGSDKCDSFCHMLESLYLVFTSCDLYSLILFA